MLMVLPNHQQIIFYIEQLVHANNNAIIKPQTHPLLCGKMFHAIKLFYFPSCLLLMTLEIEVGVMLFWGKGISHSVEEKGYYQWPNHINQFQFSLFLDCKLYFRC